MVEDIQFKELRGRINNILLQLSGLVQPLKDKIGLLESLYKEFEHQLEEEEKQKVIQLFTNTFTKTNMARGSSGRGFNQKIIYVPSLECLNLIEMELRRLLSKYGFYKIVRENKDYQVGEY